MPKQDDEVDDPDRGASSTRKHFLRPSGDVGPEGLTDAQIDEMAQAMADALWEDYVSDE